MSDIATLTDRRSQLVSIAEAYFRGLAEKDMSRVPWHPDVDFRGPLAPAYPEPLRGATAVRAWFEGLYPALGQAVVIAHHCDDTLRSIATRADVHITTPPSVLRVVDRFVVNDEGLIVEQENHYDPRPALQPAPGLLTAQERDLLGDMLVSSQHGLLASIVRLRGDQWTFSPGDDRWSIAECAEHLAVSEDALLGLVRGQILGSPASPEKGAATAGRDGVVVGAMRDRSHRTRTFDFLQPKARPSSPADFILAFLQKRAATLQYVRETEDALHHHCAPLGALGDLDGYQWLLLLASHTDRHVAQIEEIKARPDYPA